MTSPAVLQESNMENNTNEGILAFDDDRLSKGILLLDTSLAAASQGMDGLLVYGRGTTKMVFWA